MGIRHDILADASAAGLGTGFLVKDSVTGNYRALASNELNTVVGTWAGTQNAGLSSSQGLRGTTYANSLTISGTATLGTALDATAFGKFGPNGGLLTQSMSNASAILVLAGATGNINGGALQSTTTGTTPYIHVVAGGTLNVNAALGIGGTAGLLKADGGVVWVDLTVTAVRDGSGQLRHFAAQMTDVLTDRISLAKLQRLIYGPKTEKSKILFPDDPPGEGEKPKPKARGHGRKKQSDYPGAKNVPVPHATLKAGDICPKCGRGSLIQLPPANTLCVDAHPPLTAQRFQQQRFRCVPCGTVFTAALPPEAPKKGAVRSCEEPTKPFTLASACLAAAEPTAAPFFMTRLPLAWCGKAACAMPVTTIG